MSNSILQTVMNSSDNVQASVPHSETDSSKILQFVGFCLAEQEYAFRIEQIQEIIVLNKITPLPQVADYVEGVSNLRGTIIPIVHLGRLLGLPEKQPDQETRIMVVNVGSRIMGCIVDSVTQVLKISRDSIQPAPQLVSPADCAYVAGFAKHDDRTIILLDIDNLLDPEKLETVHEHATEPSPKPSTF